MSTESRTIMTRSSQGPSSALVQSQTLRASTALLRKIQADEATEKRNAKANLLEDADDDDQFDDETPVWMVLTTKKHIVDKKRLKPGKIALPHPYLNAQKEGLRVCLITTDPQRRVKDLIAQGGFPLELAAKVKRVIGLEKLKAKYKSYESRRQLLSEFDVFLADDRIITYLPQLLGKIFYKSSSKRPVPITLEGKRQNFDEQGKKRQKLSEGGSKVVKSEPRAQDVAKEIEAALSSALVHLAPSTTTSVKVGTASQTAEQLQENIHAVVEAVVEKFVPQQWKNLRSVHVKGPNTAALPIWLTEELWESEQDVLDEAPPKANESKKRKRGALTAAAADVIEVPWPDGQTRRLEKPSSKRKSNADETTASPAVQKRSKKEDADQKAEKAVRKKSLASQKNAARGKVTSNS